MITKEEVAAWLAESAWRLRAYLGSEDVADHRVGWRGDPSMCPIAEWLEAEAFRTGATKVAIGVVGDEAGVVIDETDAWLLPVPPVLQVFQDIIDGAVYIELSQQEWPTSRVSRRETLMALTEAERRVDRLLLPAPRCAAPGCEARVITPQVEGFIYSGPSASPARAACYQFAGGLCRSHIANIIVPPDTWWEPEVAPARQLVGARR